MQKLKTYLYNNLYALDILGNTLAGGSYKEPISSRLGKNPRCSWLAAGLHWALDKRQPNHCEDSAKNHMDVKQEENVF